MPPKRKQLQGQRKDQSTSTASKVQSSAKVKVATKKPPSTVKGGPGHAGVSTDDDHEWTELHSSMWHYYVARCRFAFISWYCVTTKPLVDYLILSTMSCIQA